MKVTEEKAIAILQAVELMCEKRMELGKGISYYEYANMSRLFQCMSMVNRVIFVEIFCEVLEKFK